ncbi:MAG: hypothetical protein JNM27_17150 [Leptospirales bacterium]|nr:hypothetical protein [Leptospirales bacterium]
MQFNRHGTEMTPCHSARMMLHLFRKLAIALILVQPAVILASEWRLARSENGIEIYLKESHTGSEKDIRASVRIRSTTAAALNLIRNAEQCSEWIHYCKSGRVLQNVSQSEWIVYSITSLPFPLKARDTILASRVESQNPGPVRIMFRTIPDYLPNDPMYVRIRDLSGSWSLLETPTGLNVVYEFRTDPGGLFPDWFVNDSLTNQPYQTLLNMRRLLERQTALQNSANGEVSAR